jgi:exportin-1
MWVSLTQEGTPVNCELFTAAAEQFVNSSGIPEAARNAVHEALNQFTVRRDLPAQIAPILTSDSCSPSAKYLALTALRHHIRVYWYSIAPEDRAGIRGLLWELLCQWAPAGHAALSELRQALGSIAQLDYPAEWPTFVADVLSACQASPQHDAAFFPMIANFSDDVTEFASDSLTSARAGVLVKALSGEVDAIMRAIDARLSQGDSRSIESALQVLQALAHWVDPSYLLGTPMLLAAIPRLLPTPEFVVPMVRIIGQVLTASLIPEDYYERLPPLFTTVVDALRPQLQDSDMRTVDSWLHLFFAETLPSFIDQYGEVVEVPEYAAYVIQCVQWTIATAAVADEALLSSCVDFLRSLLQRMWSGFTEDSFVVQLYTPLLPDIRRVLMERIPSPLAFEDIKDEDGLEARKLHSCQGFGDLFTAVKDALMYIARMDRTGTLAQIEEMRMGVQENPDGLNAFCWAVGAVVPALSEQTERIFVSQTIGFLIELCGGAPDLQTRNAAASNVCFLCGQAAKFLFRDEELFVNVAHWMLSLLAENDADLQNVAVECMKMLVKHNRDQMVASILDRVLAGICETVGRLQRDAAVAFLEIVAQLITSVPPPKKEEMAQAVVELLDKQLRECLTSFEPYQPEKCHTMVFLLECHRAICSHLGDVYINYLIHVLPMLVESYAAMTQAAAHFLDQHRQHLPHFMSAVTDNIIFLIDRAIFNTCHTNIVRERILPVCLGQILDVFAQAPPPVKCPRVFALFGSLSFRCSAAISEAADRVFATLYHPILALVRENDSFESHDALRPAFFEFLGALIRSSMNLLLTMPDLPTFVDGVQWGARHPQHEISARCTGLLAEFISGALRHIAADQRAQFTAQVGVQMLLFGLDLMTDTVHKFAISEQIHLLRVTVGIPGLGEYAQEIMNGVYAMFEGTPPADLTEFMLALFNHAQDQGTFNRICKDFLIQVKHILPQDPDLRAAEKTALLKEAREAFLRQITEQAEAEAHGQATT